MGGLTFPAISTPCHVTSRIVQAELLDSLPHDHPDARRSRRDLRVIDRLKEKRLEAWREAGAREDQKETDSVALVMMTDVSLPKSRRRRNSATLRALPASASMRNFIVSNERISSHVVCGSHIVPRIVRMPRTGSILAREPEQLPAIKSE